MIDKNLIGYFFEPVQLAVEAGRLKFVAKVLGLTDPVYTDVDAARAEGYSDLLAPPTTPSQELTSRASGPRIRELAAPRSLRLPARTATNAPGVLVPIRAPKPSGRGPRRR